MKGSESQNLSLDIWRDLLNTLSGKSRNTFLAQSSKIRDDIRRYATEQKLLSQQEVCLLKYEVLYIYIYIFNFYCKFKTNLYLVYDYRYMIQLYY